MDVDIFFERLPDISGGPRHLMIQPLQPLRGSLHAAVEEPVKDALHSRPGPAPKPCKGPTTATASAKSSKVPLTVMAFWKNLRV